MTVRSPGRVPIVATLLVPVLGAAWFAACSDDVTPPPLTKRTKLR